MQNIKETFIKQSNELSKIKLNENTSCCIEKPPKEETKPLGQKRLGGDFFLKQYIPKKEQPITFICINIHFFQDSNGDNNFKKCDIERWLQILEWVNAVYAFNALPSDVVSCGTNKIPQQGLDTRIRFVLNRMEFYQDNSLHTSLNMQTLYNAVLTRDSEMANQLNILLPNSNIPPHVNGLPSLNMNEFKYVAMKTNYFNNQGDYATAMTLVHEFGHFLGLSHTYIGGGASANLNENDDFYMFDIFGCSPSSTAPHLCDWSMDPFTSTPLQKYTNNLMGGSQSPHWISTLQIAQMHYSIKNLSIKKYVRCCGSKLKIGFGAKLNRHKSNDINGTQLVYPITNANYGWAFDGSTFTAPCDGLFSISVSFQKDSLVEGGTPNWIWIHLIADEYTILSTASSERSDARTMWSPDGHNEQFGRRDSVGFSNVFDLKKGTILKTVVHSENNELRHICDVSFSGFLITPKNYF